MMRLLRLPFSRYIQKVEKELVPANYPEICKKYQELDSLHYIRFENNYIKSLEEDLFEGTIAPKKEEFLDDISDSDITDSVKRLVVEQTTPLKNVAEFFQLLKSREIQKSVGDLYSKIEKPNAEHVDMLREDINTIGFLLNKFFARKTTDPNIFEVGKKLKFFGVDEAILGDNLQDAVAIFKGTRRAHQHGDIIPKRVLVSEVRPQLGLGEAFPSLTRPGMQISSAGFREAGDEYLVQLEKRLSKKFKIWILPNELKQKILNVARYGMVPYKKSPLTTVLHELGHINDAQIVNKSQIELTPQELEIMYEFTQRRPIGSEGFADLYTIVRLFGIEKLPPALRNIFIMVGGKP